MASNIQTESLPTDGEQNAVSSLPVTTAEETMAVAPPENAENVVVVLRPITDRPVYKLTVKLIETYKNINKVGKVINSCS